MVDRAAPAEAPPQEGGGVGNVLSVRIVHELERSYIDYAMSTIVSRALPDVRDGLKPIHRRILYAMREAGNTPERAYRKSASSVGDVMGRYHPHGDLAIYDALIRMAQDFSLRYPLIDGHGNLGSIDGDPPAASRYTEARLAPLAMEMLRDIDRDTVDFAPNYDETRKEPTVLPSRFPNLLVNGSSGIAVAMATNIPPHNLGEVIDGLMLMIDNPAVTTQELMAVIPGPDFPTGGEILGRDGIRAAYETGRGLITVRAKAELDVAKNGRTRIVVTELPYQVNKSRLIERIAELVRDRRIEGITDLRDETGRHGMRVVMELRRDAIGRVVLNQLFKFTQLQETFGVIMLALVDGEPRVLSLSEVLREYLDHQLVVVTRRTRYDLERAKERAHIVEGLRIALAHLDDVIRLIRASATPDDAKRGLIETFGFSDRQAQAILDMRLQRLTGLERDKIEAEYRELLATIEHLTTVLADERLVYGIICQELLAIRERYGDGRRTTIAEAAGGLADEDLIPDETAVITLTHQGYIKRLAATTYRSQRRGGRGVTGMGTKEEDFVENLFITTTHHYLLFFSTAGKVYALKVYDIPEAGRQAKGTAIVNLLDLGGGEQVAAIIPVRGFDSGGFLLFATKNGICKRTALEEYQNIRRSGIIAFGLDEGDELVGVRLTQGDEEILLVTRWGQSIRFREDDARPMGRTARGVKAMELAQGDGVVALDSVSAGTHLLCVTNKGYGKRVPMKRFRLQKRGGLGIRAMSLPPRVGVVVGVHLVTDSDEVMIITAQGVLIRMRVKEIPVVGRNAQGVLVMRPNPGDELVSIARIAGEELDDESPPAGS
ncbi:MAG: DNA gyrase subunit A [Bacillota bacterium]|nr:DNA gyrase subunit A [Bacillota bacterium]